MENELNINNLRIFVEALNKLPDYIQNNQVDMKSIEQPTCGTVGCHGGLISIVAEYIPKLKSLYPQELGYDYFAWANALAEFLGFDDDGYYLKKWAHNNPELWGNKYGIYMFGTGKAFGRETNVFTHFVIIEHWAGVLYRAEQQKELTK